MRVIFFGVCGGEDLRVIYTFIHARIEYGVACLWEKNVVHFVLEYAPKMLWTDSGTHWTGSYSMKAEICFAARKMIAELKNVLFQI